MQISKVDFIPIVRRLVGDVEKPELELRYDEDFVNDAIAAALMAVAGYSGELIKMELEATESLMTEFELPENMLRVIRFGILDGSGGIEWYSQTEIEPETVTTGYEKSYEVLGNVLVVSPSLDEGTEAELRLEVAWEWPDTETRKIDLPLWVVEALPFYAAYYLLTLMISRFSVESQWKTRSDSGRPVDNPAKEGADWFLAQFQERCRANIRQVM